MQPLPQEPGYERGPIVRRAVFGQWLSGSRGTRSIDDVAGRAGMSRYTYRRLELGARKNVTIEELERVASAVGVDRREVLRRAREAGF